MTNPIKLTELNGDTVLSNANMIESIKQFNGETNIFIDGDSPASYKVK